MLASDGVGLLAALLLTVPAARDQVNRFQEAREQRKARQQGSPFSPLREDLARVWRGRREGYNGWDSLLTGIGAFLLFATFALKLAEL